MIATCNQCGTGRALPLPNEESLNRLYTEGLYWEAQSDSIYYDSHVKSQSRFRWQRAISHLAPPTKTLKVLDYGAGRGYLADILSEMKGTYLYYFVEPDPASSRTIKKKSSSRVDIVEFQQDSTERFDLIFLNQVLEHVNDPIALIAALSDKLTSNGVLYVETPNNDNIFKDEVFPHIFFFTAKSFTYIQALTDTTLAETKSFGTVELVKRSLPYKMMLLSWRLLVRSGFHSMADFTYRKIFFSTNSKRPMWVYAIFMKNNTV